MPEVITAENTQVQQEQIPDEQTVAQHTGQDPAHVVSPEKPEAPVQEQGEIRLTEEDIREGIETQKTNVQKRIDKLTAEKYHNLDEIKKLREELDNLKNAINKPQEKEYTESQLDEALRSGIEEGKVDLVNAVIKERIKKAVSEAEKRYTEPQDAEKERTKRQNDMFARFVSSLNVSDPDYDFSNPTSAAYKYTQYYLQSPDYKEHYNAFGDYAIVQAANDAIRVISEQKRQKQNNTKLRTTEKDLAKERIKNQFGAGNAYLTPDVDIKQQQPMVIKDPNVDDALSEFLKTRNTMSNVNADKVFKRS